MGSFVLLKAKRCVGTEHGEKLTRLLCDHPVHDGREFQSVDAKVTDPVVKRPML